jgi:hypothetical protein
VVMIGNPTTRLGESRLTWQNIGCRVLVVFDDSRELFDGVRVALEDLGSLSNMFPDLPELTSC